MILWLLFCCIIGFLIGYSSKYLIEKVSKIQFNDWNKKHHILWFIITTLLIICFIIVAMILGLNNLGVSGT